MSSEGRLLAQYEAFLEDALHAIEQAAHVQDLRDIQSFQESGERQPARGRDHWVEAVLKELSFRLEGSENEKLRQSGKVSGSPE